MDYAIVRFGNKQHRVRHGETLVVERLANAVGDRFAPDVLFGEADVTATVVAHERGPKLLIGKYRRRTGYKRHTGFRAATSRVEIALGSAEVKPKRATSRVAKPEATASAVEAAVAPSVETAPAVESNAPVEAAAAEQAELAQPAAPAAAPSDAGSFPEGYQSMTVAQIAAAAGAWSQPQLEAALSFERDHQARKGAVAALEAALEKEDA